MCETVATQSLVRREDSIPFIPPFFRVLGGCVSVTMLTPSPLGHAHLQVHHEVPDRLRALQVGCATCSGGKVVIFQERRKLYSVLLFSVPLLVPLFFFLDIRFSRVKGGDRAEPIRSRLLPSSRHQLRKQKKVLREILELPFTPGMFIYVFIYMCHI